MTRPAMTWKRVWACIRAAQQYRIHTSGQWAALERELWQMTDEQRRRFAQEVLPYYGKPEVPT